MPYNVPARVLREMRHYAKLHDVKKVILFGSRARGDNTERSDIDIAVTGGDFDGFYFDIKEKINSLLLFDIIDLNNTISDELAAQIKEDGVLLYEEV